MDGQVVEAQVRQLRTAGDRCGARRQLAARLYGKMQPLPWVRANCPHPSRNGAAEIATIAPYVAGETERWVQRNVTMRLASFGEADAEQAALIPGNPA
jgi:hypothetical protein